MVKISSMNFMSMLILDPSSRHKKQIRSFKDSEDQFLTVFLLVKTICISLVFLRFSIADYHDLKYSVQKQVYLKLGRVCTNGYEDLKLYSAQDHSILTIDLVHFHQYHPQTS